ncbi:HNH endonuclease [Planctomyces sp. SH-PL14]|uniref:HNH endonuclease n=1 Tax=Planctomyces sp. SH-PL14 TaxID=1632864 RepID=UPI00078C9F36|nr:hypothetical protein [Planctomyces sp. SH-PL14]AMV20453.1 hypothetical protein VT03_21320 [Planctomyces sp. SH-PL14]
MSAKTMVRHGRAGKVSFQDLRAEALLNLGGITYDEYLALPLWRSIRERVLNRENRICRLCAAEATQVHHRTYDLATMLGDDISALVALCGTCHELIEFDGDRKCSPRETELRFRKFRGKEGRIILRKKIDSLVSRVRILERQVGDSGGSRESAPSFSALAEANPSQADELLRRAQEFHRQRAYGGGAAK